MISEIVTALPAVRQGAVLERFREAGRLLNDGCLAQASLFSAGRDYFSLGIECPFLEDESCSIHAERPVACRDHLVTSPSRYCEDFENGFIECVVPSVRVSECLARLAGRLLGGPPTMIPLVHALDWAAENERDGSLEWESAFLTQSLLQLMGGGVTVIPSCWSASREPSELN